MSSNTDIIKDTDPLWSSLASVELDGTEQRRTDDERKHNSLRHVDHLGFGCRNAEVTRHFYEDILGMPLVMTVIVPDPASKHDFCHFFFETGSGTYLAFFDHPWAFTEDDFRPSTALMRHIAIEVAKDDLVGEYRQRLEAAGVSTKYIDHGVYHSLYFADPDGNHLEITFKPECNREFEAKSRKVARQMFNRWMDKRAVYPQIPHSKD